MDIGTRDSQKGKIFPESMIFLDTLLAVISLSSLWTNVVDIFLDMEDPSLELIFDPDRAFSECQDHLNFVFKNQNGKSLMLCSKISSKKT
jgi:hypothetical protein